MASPYKTSKAELVAIYRLEFYKKQKNWKYYSQERKKEEEKRRAARHATRAKLNQTYNIPPAPERDTDPVDTEAEELKDLKLAGVEETELSEKEADVEEELPTPSEDKEDNLNEAFVETETDESPALPVPLDAPGALYSPKWSIQHWAAQCRQLCTQQPACPTQTYPTNPNQLDPNYLSNSQCYGVDVPHLSPDLPQCGASQHEHWEQFGGNEDCEEGWPVQSSSQAWSNRQEWFECPPEAAAEAAGGDAVDGAEWALLGSAQRWLRGPDQSDVDCCDSLPSVSSGSFSRGAALAPHSSEIDLRIPTRPEAAVGLSAAALAAAVARHAAALRALLAEAGRRAPASTSPVNQFYSFEEYPTRDVGPSCPNSVTSAVSDVIITGSFRNRPDLWGHTEPRTGRGRGKRLDKAIIGIGRGRPYRL